MPFAGLTYLVDVLALKLGDEGVQALLIGLDTGGLEHALDVGGGRAGVTSDSEEKVGSEVLHFDRSTPRLLVLRFARSMIVTVARKRTDLMSL